MGRSVDWAVQDVAQLRQWLEGGRQPREMRAMRPDWSLESIKSKLKQLRRGAPDKSRPMKRRRTSEFLAETEVAVNETPRQTLSMLRRHSSLDMSRSTLWRALHEDLQARCFKPVRTRKLTAATRLARLNFCRDVLQRVGTQNEVLEALDKTLQREDRAPLHWRPAQPDWRGLWWIPGAVAGQESLKTKPSQTSTETQTTRFDLKKGEAIIQRHSRTSSTLVSRAFQSVKMSSKALRIRKTFL